MKILVVGSGGREHALAWKLSQSKNSECVFVAPGNAGSASEPGIENIAIAADDIDGLLRFAQENNIDLTVVGPEGPLVLGIVDTFNAAGLAIFGPTKAAAQLEGSKAFCKNFLINHNIPTAAYAEFSAFEAAKQYLHTQQLPIVIKADGLAAGKGVVIAESIEEAEEALHSMLDENQFGDAGHRVIIEEFLSGEEASFICMIDGKNILPLATSQDHKARDDGDKGPNTGGMGAYSPAPVVTPEIHQKILDQVIQPTVDGMNSEGNPFTGFLYAGLMISPSGELKVLEYNVRFGDPETQPILSRLQSDFTALCLAGAEQKLDTMVAEWDSRCAVGVVLAAGGYPNSYTKGHPISGIDKANENTKVFHAGTIIKDNQITTSGGRVLCVVGLGNSVSEAKNITYQGVDHIQWEGAFCRRDIGHKAINR